MPSRPSIFRLQRRRERCEINAEADVRRGSARERGYTPEFDRASQAFKFTHPLCLGCEAVGRLTGTAVTDHVVPHKGDMVVFWDQSRWQPACRFHHDVVKQRLELMYAKGEIRQAQLWLNSAAAIRLTVELRG
jgi:5-methylcytosine-specific restriction endonuclease McrA